MPEEIDEYSTRTPESTNDSPLSSDFVVNSFADISGHDSLETEGQGSPYGVMEPASLPRSSPSVADDFIASADDTGGCSAGLIVSVPRAELAWNGTATESKVHPNRESIPASSDSIPLLPPPELFTQL